jgi:hypothetical protein
MIDKDVYLNVLSEPRRIVVTGGLCIAKRLENGVRGEDLALDL